MVTAILAIVWLLGVCVGMTGSGYRSSAYDDTWLVLFWPVVLSVGVVALPFVAFWQFGAWLRKRKAGK